MNHLTSAVLAILALAAIAEPFRFHAQNDDPSPRTDAASPDLASRVVALERRVGVLEGEGGQEPGGSVESARKYWREAVARLEAAERGWQEDLLVEGGASSDAVARDIAQHHQTLAADVATLRAEREILGARRNDLVAEHGTLSDEVAVVEAASVGNGPTAPPSPQKIQVGEQITWAEIRLDRLNEVLTASEGQLAVSEVRLREAMAASLRSTRLTRAVRGAERRCERTFEALLAAEDAASRR